MNQVQKDLIAAKELIKDPKNWTFGSRAKNAKGEIVHTFNSSAVCFCSVGAVEKVLGDRVVDCISGIYSELNPTIKFLNAACREYGFKTVWGFNDEMYLFSYDGSGHNMVMDIFDDAIQLAGDEK